MRKAAGHENGCRAPARNKGKLRVPLSATVDYTVLGSLHGCFTNESHQVWRLRGGDENGGSWYSARRPGEVYNDPECNNLLGMSASSTSWHTSRVRI